MEKDFTEQWRQLHADKLLAMELQTEENLLNRASDSNVDLKALLQQLSQINNNEVKKHTDNSWATGYGIDTTLKKYLGLFAHIIDPSLSSIFSPVDPTNRKRAHEGAMNYLKLIAGYTIKTVF